MRVNALTLHFVGNVEYVGRCHHDDVRLKIVDQLNLLLRLPSGHRDDGTAQAFGSVVSSQTSREQAVTVGNVDFVAAGTSTGTNAAGNDVSPGVDIALGVTDHGGLSGSAAGGMNANDFIHWGGEHAKWVIVSEIGLVGERNFGQIVQRIDVHWLEADFVKRVTIEGHIGVGVSHAPAQALELFVAKLINAGGLQSVEVAEFL